jgi:hypothetical protein
MKNIKTQMDTVKNNCDSKLKQGMQTLKDNMKIIRARILNVQSKLNLVSDSFTYSNEDRDKLNKMYEESTQPGKVYNQLEEVKGKLEQFLEYRNMAPSSVPSEAFNQMSTDEKRRVITVMKEQTKGVFSLTKIIKSNAYKLDVIEKVISEVKHEKERESAFSAFN